MKSDRFEELMVKVVDETASPEEREELMSHVAGNPELMKELENQRAIRAVTDGWMKRLEADLVEDRARESGPGRAERFVGVVLIVVATAVLTGWGVVEALLDDTAPLVVRVCIGGIVAGSLLLLFHVVRTRLAARRTDPYEKVIR